MAKPPSLAQMINRANAAHITALQYRAAGRQIYDDHEPSESELRGMKTAIDTLSRWGCLDHGGITPRGYQLLQALRSRA